MYKLRVTFSSILEVGSSSLESSPSLELKSLLVTSEYAYLESSDTFSVPIASNSTSNLKTQFMSILKEQIGKILNKQRSVNGFVNYLLKMRRMKLTKNGVVNYILEIGNKILKYINKKIVGHLLEISNPKSLEFVNLIFDTG